MRTFTAISSEGPLTLTVNKAIDLHLEQGILLFAAPHLNVGNKSPTYHG